MPNAYYPAEITTPSSRFLVLQAIHHAWVKLRGDSPPLCGLHIFLGHWGLETGWGKEMYCYNLGNVNRAAPGPAE